MAAIVARNIGVGGDFATLADFAAALPADLVMADEIWVAELFDGPADPGGAVIETICDATRYVVVRAAAGQGPADRMDPGGDPLRATPSKGAMIDAVTGDAILVQGASTRVEVFNLQVAAQAAAALTDDGAAAIARIEGCIIEADTSVAAVSLRGGVISHSTILQRGSGDGLALSDGALAQGCTLVKTPRVVADGVGITFAGTPVPGARSCFVSGFRQAYGTGAGTAEALVSDQENVLAVSDDFADPFWTAVAATVNAGDTVPGPYSVPLQWLGNNLNAFSRFDGPVVASVAPGERMKFTLIVAQPTALVSAILLDSSAGRPELRVTWTSNPPGIGLLGQVASFAARAGTVTDLGNGLWRLYLEAENTTAAPIDVLPSVYVTRDVSNSGLNVGLYAGSMMAGTRHLGTGYVGLGAVPGLGAVEGVDPDLALISVADGTEDLRPVAAGPLAGVGGADGMTDLYLRYRNSPDTAGAVSLEASEVASADEVAVATTSDAVRLVDQDDVVTAVSRRTVLPAGPNRRIGV